MPSGKKYKIHQNTVRYLSKNNSYSFIGSYKEYKEIFYKNNDLKNCDLISLKENKLETYEIKCHKNNSDWGEISWDQALRLLNGEFIIINEYEQNNIKKYIGNEFVSMYCYFTKNGRIHYNYQKPNKRVKTHPVTVNKLNQALDFFK